MEDVPNGCTVRYENTGANADVTDRCLNGGTIINYAVPKTSDTANPVLWIALTILGVAGIILAVIWIRKKNK